MKPAFLKLHIISPIWPMRSGSLPSLQTIVLENRLFQNPSKLAQSLRSTMSWLPQFQFFTLSTQLSTLLTSNIFLHRQGSRYIVRTYRYTVRFGTKELSTLRNLVLLRCNCEILGWNTTKHILTVMVIPCRRIDEIINLFNQIMFFFPCMTCYSKCFGPILRCNSLKLHGSELGMPGEMWFPGFPRSRDSGRPEDVGRSVGPPSRRLLTSMPFPCCAQRSTRFRIEDRRSWLPACAFACALAPRRFHSRQDKGVGIPIWRRSILVRNHSCAGCWRQVSTIQGSG